jgi:hypothetical protein
MPELKQFTAFREKGRFTSGLHQSVALTFTFLGIRHLLYIPGLNKAPLIYGLAWVKRNYHQIEAKDQLGLNNF